LPEEEPFLMNKHPVSILILILALSFLQTAMGGRHGQYDEEARAIEKLEKEQRKAGYSEPRSNPAVGIAKGVGTVASGPAKMLAETAETTGEEPPIIGTLEGARTGSEQLLDSTLKGAYKVATLGMGNLQSYEVEEPEAGSGDPTKIKLLKF